jgi:nitrous oxidase accessory protein
MLAIALFALVLDQTAAGQMAGTAPATLEGRPVRSDASPVQTLIDRAAPGGTVEIGPGTYRGDLVIDRPMRLVGRGHPLLVGSGRGSVVRVRADDVLIEGVDIDGLGGGDLGRDASGIHVSGARATIRDCRIVNTLFGVYLREANDATVERSSIHGIHGKDPGEKGSGIHVWDTIGFTLIGNELADVRDAFYIQSSSRGFIAHNTARDLRYGLHYMFSDDNSFEDNVFERGAAGAALMYSRRITFRRNRLLHNRGFASVGLLLKACDDVVAEDNLIADNARGIFIEGSYRNRFRRNIVSESDTAVVLYDSAAENIFEGNAFIGNLTPLTLSGRRTDTRFDGNYWSGNDEPDLDGDGRSDRPYRLSSVFDHLRSNLTAADLMTPGFAATALGIAERAFPVLEPISVVDRAPLVGMPPLPNVPRERHAPRRTSAGGLAVSFGGITLGLVALLRRGHR